MVDELLHITDLHFWEIVWNPLRLLNKRLLGNANLILRRRKHLKTHRAEAYADFLSTLGVGTVLAGGDFTSTAMPGEFRDAAAFLQRLADQDHAIIALPGNHDVYTFDAGPQRCWDRYFNDFSPQQKPPVRILLPGGTPLVLAPTVCPNVLSSNGRITDTEIMETATLVAEAPDGPVLVGAHYPVLEKTPAYHSGSTRRLRQAAAFREALAATGRTVLYMAGHVHRFSALRDEDYPNLYHMTTNALFYEDATKERYGGFSRVQIEENRFTIRQYHYSQNDWQHREVTLPFA